MAKNIDQIADRIADEMVAGLKRKGEEKGLNVDAIDANSPAIKKDIKKAVLKAAEKNPELFADKTKSEEQAAAVERVMERDKAEYTGLKKAVENIAGSKHPGWAASMAPKNTIVAKLTEGGKEALPQVLASNGDELSAAMKPPEKVASTTKPPALPSQTTPNRAAETKTSGVMTASAPAKTADKPKENVAGNDPKFGAFSDMAKALEQFGMLPKEVEKVAENAAKIMDKFVQAGLSGANGDLASLGRSTLDKAPAEVQKVAQEIANAASKILS